MVIWGLLGTASCGGAPTPVAAPPPATVAPPPPAPPPPPGPASAKGIWLGTIHAGPQQLRVQLHLDPADAGHGCALDSLDQGAMGIPCRVTVGPGDAVALDVPAVHGTWTGTLSADGTTLTGTWTQQGAGIALVLTRQAAAIEARKEELQPAMAAVDVAGLQAVLDADLRSALDAGDLAAGTGAGVTLGVVQRGTRRVFAYGPTKPDSVFEIGSITKTFTGLLLAQLVAQKKARLDEPVRALFPAGTVAKPAEGDEITLLDLSDQHSGLPRLPENMKPADPENPYADYDEKALFAWLGGHGVARPKDPTFGYSNLGVGLLGAALARRAGVSYEALLKQEITGPLGMHDTVIRLTPALAARLAEGHDGKHAAARPWDLDALAGAGGIRSTAGDMLTYLEAQLHPEALPARVTASGAGKTLPAAIRESHVVRARAGEGDEIALNWMRSTASGRYWHNGATGGYTAFAAFDPGKDVGVVVLSNTQSLLADKLGAHVLQRLAGEPAIALGPPVP
jgi:CubicO group peptidase (beta-lactamase class C family)